VGVSLSSERTIQYLALLADPDQRRITREAWTVASDDSDFAWGGWKPDSVVSVDKEPPAQWYEQPARVTTPKNPYRFSKDNQLMWNRLNKAVGDASLLQTVTEKFDDPDRGSYTPPSGLMTETYRELALRDELHREEGLGRAGWLFIAGTIEVGGEHIPCCFPLFERRVKFTKVNGVFLPQWQGALRRNALLHRRVADSVQDPIDVFLSEGAGSENPGGIASELSDLLRHYGITITAVTDGTESPIRMRGAASTVLVPGTGFYLAQPRTPATNNDLDRWTKRHLSDTALSQLYRTTDSLLHQPESRPSAIQCALPLNGRQREAINRLNTEAVVAVSGPPGTGKTHMIVAAASDAVARGLSVLVATKSDFAADSACELLEQFPTPPHIRFGKAEHRRRVADHLSAGSTAGISDEQLTALEHASQAAAARLARLSGEMLGALGLKQRYEAARSNENLTLATGAPNMLAPSFRFDQLDKAIADTSGTTGRRQRRSIEKLRSMIGAAENVSLPLMLQIVDGARAEHTIRTALDHAKGTELDNLWSELDRAESDARAAQTILDIARRSRPTPGALASIASLATALRSSLGGSGLRDGIEANAAFLHHLPFWIGTLDEIEATLPANPGMFDVVIFDEASQIDQLAAVPALCRARRAFVVGDPQQLRHTSAITRQQIEAARLHAQLAPGDDAALLDVAANSLFDVAAAATTITWLDEHFRSIPHLIQFSSERWYGGNLRLMTQHPRNERLDAIHPVRVLGQRTSSANEHEVQAIVARLHQIRAAGATGSIGVISPFIEQAEALEDAIVRSFDYEAIRDMRLRVGTVRGVQGTERDTILVSLVMDERDYATALPMIENRHLFNVMATRARTHLEFFHSFDPATLPRGLLADWFHYEKNPPGLAAQLTPAVSRWTTELADALQLAGVRVVTGYPVAGWTVDLVVGEGDAAFGVETTVHPAGPEAHAERHITLRRAGWHLVSVFEPSWLLKSEEAAVKLAGIASRRSRGEPN